MHQNLTKNPNFMQVMVSLARQNKIIKSGLPDMQKEDTKDDNLQKCVYLDLTNKLT